MPSKAPHFCAHPGCSELVTSTYCAAHTRIRTQAADKARGSAATRGYDYQWQKYSRRFLSRPENKICKLHLPGCTILAECVDHSDPPDGPNDPRFWDKSNHQPACLHCNSVKGHRRLKGEFEL